MARNLIEGVPYHIDSFESYIGKSLGSSDWLEVDQTRVDLFGEATSDQNPLHIDPEWAKANSPFGGPIAHGFLTLSMLSHLSWMADLQPDGVDYGINLGFERVRFLAPVMVGDGATIGAGSTITTEVEPGTLALSRTKQISKSGWKRPMKKKS